jgi:hypothetical protein
MAKFNQQLFSNTSNKRKLKIILMVQGLKLSRTENNIAKAKMFLTRFGNALLLDGSRITFEGSDDLSAAVGKPIYLCEGAQNFSLLPEGQFSLNTNCIFNISKEGTLVKIVSKGNTPATGGDPATQKQLWNNQKFNQDHKNSAMDRNVKRDDGSPRSTQLQRHREAVIYRFSNGLLYPNVPFTFPTATPQVGTSALDAAKNVLQDGIYQTVSPLGSLEIKNGLIKSFSPVTSNQVKDEVKLHKVAFSLFDDPSDAARVNFFSDVDDLDLPPTTKQGLKNDYLKRVALHVAKHTKI